MTGLDYAILGLLADAEKTGYDILKAFKASPSLHWKSTAGSVYPALSRLERQGLVVGELIPQRTRPDRRLFRLSGRGRDMFLRWLNDKTVSGDPRDVHHVLLKLVFSHHAQRPEMITLLEAYRDQVAGRLAWVEKAVAQCHEAGPVHQYLALANTAEVLRVQLRWAQMASARLGDEPRPAAEGTVSCRSDSTPQAEEVCQDANASG